MSTASPVYCTNHPKTETLLRCNRCDRPFCTRCLVRTPVGYRCKECLNIQQAGFYTAIPFDYAIAGIVGIVASSVAGAIAAAIGGFWIFVIFYAPFAGGVIAETIRRVIRKHRGRYIWLVACAALIVGSAMGAGLFPLIALWASGRDALALVGSPLLYPIFALRALFNIGFLIYIVLAVGTVYARLR